MGLMEITRGDDATYAIEVAYGTLTLATALTGGETTVTVAEPIPVETPQAGSLRIVKADGTIGTVTFTAWSGFSFTGCAGTPAAVSGAAVVPVVDLSSATLRWTAKYRVSHADDDAVIAKSTGSGITTPSPTIGAAVLAIDAADTAGLTRDVSLVYDLQLSAGGKTQTVDRGTFVVTRDVSVTAP